MLYMSFRLKSKIKGTFVTLFVLSQTILPVGTWADTMNSTNYSIEADTLSIGGGRSTSTNYTVEDTLGEMASGEGLTSTNYVACSGFQCASSAAPFITFSVKTGLTSPGTAGSPIPLGVLSTSAVTTSDGTTIKSIFLTVDSNATGGTVITVKDANNGIKRTSTADLIDSANGVISVGSEAFGICVFSTAQGGSSPSTLTKVSPFNNTCTKTTGHNVGGPTTTNQNILTASSGISTGTSEILVKASISPTSSAGSDYTDTLTFIATATF